MLENSFYTVKQAISGDNNFKVSIVLNASHEIYMAHFPGNPITPGVCLIQIALELLNSRFDRNLRLVSAKNIKYLKVINPLEHPEVDFSIQYVIENDLVIADMSIHVNDTVFTKISATYKGL